MAKLTITHHQSEKRISFSYDGRSQWNLFDVQDGSGTLEIFGRLQYALENNYELEVEVKE